MASRFAQITWVDNSGLIRGKCIRLVEGMRSLRSGLATSFADQAMTAFSDSPVLEAGLDPVADFKMCPDLESITTLPYAGNTVKVMADLHAGDSPSELCPRSFLRRAIGIAAMVGIRFRASFEAEFYLLQRSSAGTWVPTDNTLYSQVEAINTRCALLNDICAALEAQAITPIGFHAESGPGQFEIIVDHSDPLRAADNHTAVRETVRAICAQRGLQATFLPKPWPDEAASGLHLHLSLWRNGANITGQGNEVSATSSYFFGGILRHLDAVLALTSPSNNSVKRYVAGAWSGCLRGWGYSNKEVAIRVPLITGERVTHFEIKTLDSTCNHYLALGALILAGLHGVEEQFDAGDPCQEVRGQLMPPAIVLDLREGFCRLEADTAIAKVLGETMVRAYSAVRRSALMVAESMSFPEELEALIAKY